MYLPSGDQAIAILAEGMVSNMDHHPNPLLSRSLHPDSSNTHRCPSGCQVRSRAGKGVNLGGGNIA